MEKRGWITWFTRKTNKTLRQGVCTAYVGHGRLPGLLKEWRHKVPPRSDLRSPGKISRPSKPPRSRWEFSQKRRDWEKMTQGKPVFPGTGLFLYFPGPLLYFKSYIEINGKYSHVGWAVLTLIETTLSFCILSDIQSSQVIYIIFWPRGLLTFYDPFWWWLVDQKTYFLQYIFSYIS